MKHKALLGLVVLATLTVVSGANAQTTYNSVGLQGQPGEPRVAFYFGHLPNGQPGTTQLEVQCDFHRAWLITNLGTTSQLTSSSFAISCAGSYPSPYTVENTPVTATLTMSDGSKLTLSVNSAEFTMDGRYKPSTGSASITY